MKRILLNCEGVTTSQTTDKRAGWSYGKPVWGSCPILNHMPNLSDNPWGDPIYSYSRAQAIADGVLVDLTTATDDRGQLLCRQAGIKIPVAITREAWAETIEAGGTWKPDGNGDILELQGGQSLTGRLWDLLWMLRTACAQAKDNDRVRFQVLVDVQGNGRPKPVKLWALCGPGDDPRPVITIMLES